MPKEPFANLPERRKRVIAQACFTLFAEHGYSRTSMKKLTRRLRVADGYLYYYFNGKEDLTRWVIETGLKQWFEHFQTNVEDKQPENLFEFFKLSILQMIRFTKENKDLFGTYLQLLNEPDFPLSAWLHKKVAWIDTQYLQAIQMEIRKENLRPDIPPYLITMVLDVVNTRVQQCFWNPALDPIGLTELSDSELDKLVDKLVSMLCDGLRPRTEKN